MELLTEAALRVLLLPLAWLLTEAIWRLTVAQRVIAAFGLLCGLGALPFSLT